jgi:hypothetical protein
VVKLLDPKLAGRLLEVERGVRGLALWRGSVKMRMMIVISTMEMSVDEEV